MSVGFGFSVGDFIAAITLLKDCIQALNDSRGSSLQYLELIRELRNLEMCLIQVKRIYNDTDQLVQRIALEQAVQSCEHSIDNCLTGLMKYHSHLSVTGTKSRLKDSWRKVQWQLVKSKDLSALKATLDTHVQAMQTLMATIQVSSMHLYRQEAVHRDVRMERQGETLLDISHSLELINTSFAKFRGDLASQGSVAGQTIANVDALQQLMTLQHMQVLLQLDRLQKSIPAQVFLREPKIFIDALDRRSPIHLDWIDSWEAFSAVLEIRFKNLGLSKIRKGEFTLQDGKTRRQLSMQRDFDTSLSPITEFDMSVVFKEAKEEENNRCPRCLTDASGELDQEIECQKCHCVFQRILEELEPSEPESGDSAYQVDRYNDGDVSTIKESRARSTTPASPEVQPSDFKRLRLMLNKPRAPIALEKSFGQDQGMLETPVSVNHSEATWEAHRETIRILYKNMGMSLAQVATYMQKHHKFQASHHMYEQKIDSWGWLQSDRASDLGSVDFPPILEKVQLSEPEIGTNKMLNDSSDLRHKPILEDNESKGKRSDHESDRGIFQYSADQDRANQNFPHDIPPQVPEILVQKGGLTEGQGRKSDEVTRATRNGKLEGRLGEDEVIDHENSDKYTVLNSTARIHIAQTSGVQAIEDEMREIEIDDESFEPQSDEEDFDFYMRVTGMSRKDFLWSEASKGRMGDYEDEW